MKLYTLSGTIYTVSLSLALILISLGNMNTNLVFCQYHYQTVLFKASKPGDYLACLFAVNLGEVGIPPTFPFQIVSLCSNAPTFFGRAISSVAGCGYPSDVSVILDYRLSGRTFICLSDWPGCVTCCLPFHVFVYTGSYLPFEGAGCNPGCSEKTCEILCILRL